MKFMAHISGPCEAMLNLISGFTDPARCFLVGIKYMGQIILRHYPIREVRER